MRTLKVCIKKDKSHGYVTLPPDLIKQKDLDNGDTIVMVYLCKSGEELDELN